jgi:hypothetical protein
MVLTDAAPELGSGIGNMSRRDKELLRTAGLSNSDAAGILEVKPQAVSQGMQRKADYLAGDRLAKLFERVLKDRPAGAQAMLEYLRDARDDAFEPLMRLSLGIKKLKIKDTTEDSAISHLWVFSASPIELRDSGKLKQIEERFFSNPDFSIVYFVPPRVSLSMRGLLLGVLTRLLRERSASNFSGIAHVEIVECPAVDLMPHFAIANPIPSSQGRPPTGAVLIGESDEEAPLPARQIRNILNVLYANGIGVDPVNIVPKVASGAEFVSSGWGGLEFRSIFSSRDITEVAEARSVGKVRK